MKQSNTIGNRIEALRKSRKETQADLAKSLHVLRETVNQWESGTRDLKTQYTISLADHFGVTCDYLLRGIKADNVSVHEKTGLSNDAIEMLAWVSAPYTEPEALQGAKEKMMAYDAFSVEGGFEIKMEGGKTTTWNIPKTKPPKNLSSEEDKAYDEFLQHDTNVENLKM